MCIAILNMHANVCEIPKLSNPFNWFYNTLVKLVLQYSKGYEIVRAILKVMRFFD